MVGAGAPLGGARRCVGDLRSQKRRRGLRAPKASPRCGH